MKLFCKHDYISLGKYYEAYVSDRRLYTPQTAVDVWETWKCTKCDKIKHEKLFTKIFNGWNDNRDYQLYLHARGITGYSDWVLSF